MTKDRVQQCIWGGVLALGITLGSLGCAVSGLELLSGSEQLGLIVWCALWAAVLTALMPLRLAPLVFPALAAGLGFCWFHTGLKADVSRLVYEISSVYHAGYGWDVISWSGKSGDLVDALRAAALVLMLPICWVVNRKGSVWVAVPLTLVPLASTLLLTDTVPAVGYLFMYILGIFVLLLTQGTRRRDPRQGNNLSAKASAVAGAALLLIFLLNPQKGYDKQHLAVKLENVVMDLAMKIDPNQKLFPMDNWDAAQMAGDIPASVALDEVGPKTDRDQRIMTVSSDYEGVVYLRGASYDYYDGTTWITTGQPDGRNQWPRSRNSERFAMTITTDSVHTVLYLPYYSGNLQALENGRLPNDKNFEAYQLTYNVIPPGKMDTGADMTVDGLYTQLPGFTQRWAEKQAQSLLDERLDLMDAQQVQQAAAAIASYVRSSAKYSLKTPEMPGDTLDFVRWFLEESDTGYCVHFASSAVVLLRSVGIPARYVTGYMVKLSGKGETEVMATDAHAWVEYYLPGVGWMVLEVTPGNRQPVQPLPLETKPPQTTPPETTPPQSSRPITTPTPPVTSDPQVSAPNPETSYQNTQPPESTPPGSTGPGGSQPGDSSPGTTTVPGGKPSGDTGEEKPLNLSWLLWVLWPLAVVAVIVLQWQIRVYLRKQALLAGKGNRRALAYWKEAELYAKLLGETPPDALLGLARKAKFSQHILTREELSAFRGYLAQSQSALKQRPFHYQLLYRLVYALY